MSYDDFKPIVDKIFNNWTALQLAVDHGMGDPGGKETALLMAVHIARHCVEHGNVQAHDLSEMLEDIMDEEFDTNCCDNSPREVANTLLLFLKLLQEGKLDEIEARLEAMPKCEMWLCQPAERRRLPGNAQTNGHSSHPNPAEPGSDSESSTGYTDDEDVLNPQVLEAICNYRDPALDHQPMEEDPDPGWTIVSSKKKNNK